MVLLHDDDHGEALIDACGRFGAGLPAHVLPLAVNEVSRIGPEILAAAMAWGAAGVRVLLRSRPKHDPAGLRSTLAMAGTVLVALGYGPEALGTIETDDPDTLAEALREPARAPARPAPSGFLPPATKRALLEQSFRELVRVAPAPVARIELDAGAPFGAVVLDREACTLCLACVSACPVAALTDNPDRPMLRFSENLCVQCGLCAETCPEDAITLAPRIDIDAWDAPRHVLHEEEPFACTKCGKAFGSAATIARVRDKLAGHWMFSGPEGEARRAVLELCDDCRVGAVMAESFDPHDPDARRVRTTDDYLRDRAERPD
jgi:ferredoxin